MLTGDDPSTQYFIAGTALAILGVGVTQAGWNHPWFVRGALGVGFLLAFCALLWKPITEAFPRIGELANPIGGSGLGWLTLLIFGLGTVLLLDYRARKGSERDRTDHLTAPDTEASNESLRSFSERISQLEQSAAANSNDRANAVIAYEVEGRIRALDKLYAALELSGGQLYQRATEFRFPWSGRQPWQPRDLPSLAQQPTTPAIAKATIPDIEELASLSVKLQQEVNSVTSQYPYREYLTEITGILISSPRISADGLIMTIRGLSDEVNQDYMMLLLRQQTSGLTDQLNRYRTWFNETKAKIEKKRQDELSLLENKSG